MLVDLEKHRVSLDDSRFTARRSSTVEYAEPFALDDALSVTFDAVEDSSVSVSAVQPVAGSPFYRITPTGLGASRWLTIECDVEVASLRTLGQLMPVLDAAAGSSATLFAILRIRRRSGGNVDVSSAQIELRRERRSHAFPLNLDDLHSDDLAAARDARLLFFIEARDVAIDYYGLELVGVARSDTANHGIDVDRLRSVAEQDPVSVAHKALNPAAPRRTRTKLGSLVSLGPNVYFDLDAENGQAVCRRSRTGLEFDLAGAAECRWRSFEFRFEEVNASDQLTAFVSLVGSADTTARWTSIRIVARVYHEDSWHDSGLIGTLDLNRQNGQHEAVVDLAPALPDDEKVHTVGLMFFLPSTCRSLRLERFETFLFDRGADKVVESA